MSDGDVPLEDVEVYAEAVPLTDSVKLHGPPGTGKTTTSAARVARLIRDEGYSIRDVCWVTYRRSLAKDTLVRLAEWGVVDDSQLSDPREGATRHIGTAHAVANRCADIGADPVESYQRNDFCERNDLQYWTSEPWEDSAGKLLFRVFDYLANARASPDDREAVRACPHYEDLRDHWHGDLADMYYQWQDYKAQRNLIDFYEMLERPLENGDSPRRPILVIDEYHDVTGLMHELFCQWMDDAEIVIVAGDPHQVVNAFDGASPHYFESLDLPSVLLDTTYRVGEEHWALATQLLSQAHDPPAVERRDRARVHDINSPPFEYADSHWTRIPDAETPGSPGWICDRYGAADTMFLSRTRMQADGIGRALERAGVPYRSQPELHGWNTDAGSRRLAAHNALQKIQGYSPTNFGYDGHRTFGEFEGGEQSPRSVELTGDEVAVLLRAAEASTLDMPRSDADDTADAHEGDDAPTTLNEFDTWVTREFWVRYTAGPGSVDRLNKTPFGTGADGDRDLEALKRALATQDGPIDPEDLSTAAITIHASKGMEAQDVVVYDGVSGRIRREMQRSERTRKNEMRTWYVALTRAEQRLHVVRDAFPWTVSVVPDNLQQTAARSYHEHLSRERAVDGGI